MQVYAQSKKGKVLAQEAKSGDSYLCPECLNPLGLKGEKKGQAHFFHLETNPKCYLAQKGEIDLQLQSYVQSLLDKGTQIEHPFPSIRRTADVACLKSKTVFEIECLPITLEEAISRSEDYASISYTIVWILHDHSAQNTSHEYKKFFQNQVCYFMDTQDNGEIYEQSPLRKRFPLKNFLDQMVKDRKFSMKKPRVYEFFKEIYLTLLHVALEKSCK